MPRARICAAAFLRSEGPRSSLFSCSTVVVVISPIDSSHRVCASPRAWR
jgi:hypothetical protein